MRTSTSTIRRFGVIALLLSGVALLSGGVIAACSNSPDTVGLEDAAAQVTDSAADSDSDSDSESDADSDSGDNDTDSEAASETNTEGVAGSWSVDTSVGEFGFDESTGTFVGFRVDEELSSLGAIEAVGRTPEVSGTLTITGEGESLVVSEVAIEADMTALVTDDSRRDGKAKGALGTSEFPTASFVLTESIALPASADSGDAFEIDAAGDLTVHGQTNPAVFNLNAQLVDDVVVVVGSTMVTFADFGVTPPSAPIVVSVADVGTVEFQLFFRR